MTLNERARKTRDELFVRYDNLNALWLKAEEQLTQLHVPRPVECVYHVYEPDSREPEFRIAECLGLQKMNGKWRICFGAFDCDRDDSPSHWTPITDCSAEIRVEAAEHLAKLRNAVVESAEKFIPKVDSAIQQLAETLGLSVSLNDLLAERAKLNGQAE